MEFDYRKLKGRIVEKFDSVSNFAKHLGVAVQTVSAKLNNDLSITKKDIIEWSEKLEIPVDEIGVYFFVLKV